MAAKASMAAHSNINARSGVARIERAASHRRVAAQTWQSVWQHLNARASQRQSGINIKALCT